MVFWVILGIYLVGVLLAYLALIKRVLSIQDHLTLQDIWYSFIVALFSWVAYVLFSESAGNVILWTTARFSKLGGKVIWRKKDDRQVPGRDKVVVKLPPNNNNV